MSLVERLAARWVDSGEGGPRPPGASWAEHRARWWLNAIADELEAAYHADGTEDAGDIVRWLRSATDR